MVLPLPRREVESVTLEDAVGWLDRASRDLGDLPLQVTGPSLKAQPVALSAWRKGNAQVVVGDSSPGNLTIFSLVDRNPDQAGAQALVQHLTALDPPRSVRVPQLQRADIDGIALERLGLHRLPLHQLLMRRTL